MRSGLTSFAAAVGVSIALGAGIVGNMASADAAGCPGNSRALGTSRTIVVDPRAHDRIGTMDYVETLPLADHEVVLTFDDGPLPPYTNKVLDILASECIRATYFIVGEMAKEFPALVRRAYDEGHSIGTHSYSHPIPFRTQGFERTKAQIDGGINATAAALGDAGKLSPFFRFPGFGHTPPAEDYLASRGVMIWGADAPADDWMKIGPKEIARRAINRLERKGKGVLLLHDIHERTVLALPIILEELKARGFRIVHVEAATADRTPTVTAASDWRLRSRPTLPPPVILIADVQNPGSELAAKRSVAELCTLLSAERAPVRMSARKHVKPHASGHLAHGTHFAHAEPPRMGAAASMPDIHAVQ
jgi:peptidoglycan/xylan/chitin deacetylase (PgdA/CDA1 family)